MQMHTSPQQSHYYNSSPAPAAPSSINSNGTHSDAHSHQISTSGGHTTAENMNSYHLYTSAYGQQQQHSQTPSQSQQPPPPPPPPQQYRAPPYLPPMQSSQGASTMGMASMPSMSLPSSISSSAGAMYGANVHPSQMNQAPAGLPERQVQLSHSARNDKYEFALSVEQQPQRARMCGFGDKDRRPITPPPCVRLIIKDIKTGQEVDFNEVDGSFFVLQVDLWAEDASREVNIVRASSSSPAVSISTATTTSFPPTPERPIMDPSAMVMFTGADSNAFYNPHPYQRPALPTQYGGVYYPQGAYGSQYMPSTNSSQMFTRNLIGSLTVNASRLNDPDGRTGFWFVLQDLSVRTEGFFRLKMSFIDVGTLMNGGGVGLNRSKAPILAWTFSEKFQVYSAKKFPGVIESTAISKCFAAQGIKIPIRKDNKNDADQDGDEDS